MCGDHEWGRMERQTLLLRELEAAPSPGGSSPCSRRCLLWSGEAVAPSHSTTLPRAGGSAPLSPTVACWFPLKTLRSMLMKRKFDL